MRLHLLPHPSTLAKSSLHPFVPLVLPTCQIWPPGPWCNVSNYDVVSTGLSPRSVLGYVPHWYLCKTPQFMFMRWKWQGCQGCDCSLSLCFSICKCETTGHFLTRTTTFQQDNLLHLWRKVGVDVSVGFQVKRWHSANSNQDSVPKSDQTMRTAMWN